MLREVEHDGIRCVLDVFFFKVPKPIVSRIWGDRQSVFMTRTWFLDVEHGSIRDGIVFIVFQGLETGVFEKSGSGRKSVFMTRTFWGNVEHGSIRDDIVFLVF